MFLRFKVNLVNEQQMPTFERPIISTMANQQNDERKLTQLHCKEEIIKWLISVLLIDTQLSSATSSSGISCTSNITASTAIDYHGSTSTVGSLTGYDATMNGHSGFARGSIVSSASGISAISMNETSSL